MSAYVIVEIEVTDQPAYEAYRKLAPPTLAAYGGQYIARGGATTVLEGDWQPKRLVILEFESVERATAWWQSPEYAEPKRLRQAAAITNMVMIEGTSPVGSRG